MIRKPPGIEDIFPDRIELWNRITDTARHIFKIYNYREVILPVMEYTEVFSRGLGDETDIVTKEMFTFQDRGERSLTLRPEGTASMVRAYVENGEYNRLSTCKFFYCGPMFRAERPQRGRLRQFNPQGRGIGEPHCREPARGHASPRCEKRKFLEHLGLSVARGSDKVSVAIHDSSQLVQQL